VKLDKAREINSEKQDIHVFREATMYINAYLSKELQQSSRFFNIVMEAYLYIQIVPMNSEKDLSFCLTQGGRLQDFVSFSHDNGYDSPEKLLKGECLFKNMPIKIRVNLLRKSVNI
jgi:hypothetical protein